jgi:hypothetical protein
MADNAAIEYDRSISMAPSDKIHLSLLDTGYPFSVTGNNRVMGLHETFVRLINQMTDSRATSTRKPNNQTAGEYHIWIKDTPLRVIV